MNMGEIMEVTAANVRKLKAERDAIVAELAGLRREHQRVWEEKKALEAALRKIAEAKPHDWHNLGCAFEMQRAAIIALGIPEETPVSTLCAICDQIKELHPATHPWTPRTLETEIRPRYQKGLDHE